MGGSHLTSEKLNAREVVLSSDFNRLQALASREAQNLLADASADVGGAPITGFSGPCSLTGIASSFQMALSAQQALCYLPGDSSLTADDSAYEVARWGAQNLTFSGPSGQPRIDLVVATPAMVDTDSQSRNILVDPIARTISPQNVFKTTNPQATVAVVAGTPGASPVPPAVPAGAVPLFEVYAIPTATDSTGFVVVPRMFRRAPFPWSTMNAVVDGFRLIWDLTADPPSTSSAMSVPLLSTNRVLIDGEVIDATALGGPGVFQDAGTNNPFNSAASAGWHKPYYVYAVGGRHAPQAALNGLGLASPIALIESLVAPRSDGHPSAVITGPRGATTQLGAVYVGLGFVYAGTTRRLACIMDNEWTWFGGRIAGPIELLTHTHAGSTFEAFDGNAPAQVPTISRRRSSSWSDRRPRTQDRPASLPTRAIRQRRHLGLSSAINGLIANSSASTQGYATGAMSLPGGTATPKIWVACTAGAAATSGLFFTAFEHRVRRLDVTTS